MAAPICPPHSVYYPKYSRTFRSPQEFLSFVDSKWKTTENTSGHGSFGVRYRDGLARNCATVENQGSFLPLSFEDTMKRARFGWPQAAERLRKYKLEIAERLEATVRKQVWDVTGHSIDVGRMLTGEPECCRRRKLVKDQPKMITMGITIGANCDETEETMLRRLAYPLVLVEALETLGCRVRVVANSALHPWKLRGHCCASLSVIIKDHHETMSSSIMAAWCGTITIERRFMWLVWDTMRPWDTLGNLGEIQTCNDRQWLSSCDIWFPAWEAVPSDELCKAWLFALGYADGIEWTDKQKKAYDFLQRFAGQLGKPLKPRPQ